MALDWLPIGRPREGFEAEHAAIFEKLRSGAGDEVLADRFAEISDAPATVIGAPRVGRDEAADRWLREKLAKEDRTGEFDAVREQLNGFHVLQLIPECDGFPVYSNHPIDDSLDRTSFRAQFLDKDVLGQPLYERAFQNMTAAELAGFGQELLAKAHEFARARGVEHVEGVRPPRFGQGNDAARAHVLFAAARWCLFWSERGCGLHARG